MDEKEKIIDFVKVQEHKEIEEFEKVQKEVIISIYDNLIPLVMTDKIFDTLSEDALFELRASICGHTAGYIMGMVNKQKEIMSGKKSIIDDYVHGNDN